MFQFLLPLLFLLLLISFSFPHDPCAFEDLWLVANRPQVMMGSRDLHQAKEAHPCMSSRLFPCKTDEDDDEED